MKTISTYILALLALIFLAGLQGCKQGKSEANNPADAVFSAEGSPEGSSEITISKEQFALSGMKIGTPEMKTFKQTVKVNGYIEASPTGRAMIGAPIPGKVADIKVRLGDYVKQGQELFTLESTEILLLQQDYAEACNREPLLKSTYERMMSLSKENITAGKDLIQAESDYKMLLTTMEGLKARLKMIGVNPDDVKNGRLYSKAHVSSPINGNITELNLVLGQYAQPGETGLEVIDTEQLYLYLNVFEKDLEMLSRGQSIIYYSLGRPQITHPALLDQIGKSIDMDSKTVKCIASIETKDKELFLHRSFVEAEIITCQREALALPTTALIEEDSRYYVLVKVEEKEDKMIFKKIPVKTGVLQREMVEILEEGLEDVLVAGNYNLTGE